jgi:hypothetical protein
MLQPLATQHQAELTCTTDSTPVLGQVDIGQMQQMVINAGQGLPYRALRPLGDPWPCADTVASEGTGKGLQG